MSLREHQAALLAVPSAPGTLKNKGAQPLVFALEIADGVTGDLDFTLPAFGLRLIDLYAVKTAGTAAASANTIQAQTGAGTPVTNALNMQVADQVLVRATTIDDAQHTFGPSGTLRIRRVKAGENAACVVYATCLRV